MDKVIISVAPVAATDNKIDPMKIASDVIACGKAGASMVHLHVRDKQGNLTEDLSVLKEIVTLIRQESDIIIQASTGGVSDLTIGQRCAPLYYDQVETCSLNVGSTNLGKSVYKNPIDEVEYCVEQILKTHKIPEVEVFEIGHIHTVQELRKDYAFIDPLLFSIVLGHPGAAPATVEALTAMIGFIPGDCLWGITHAHRKDFSIILAALSMGARTVRIGFEDSNYLDENTQVSNNCSLVEKTAELIRIMGKEPATSNEAREILKVGGR